MSAVFRSTDPSMDPCGPSRAMGAGASRLRTALLRVCITAFLSVGLAACGGDVSSTVAQPLAAVALDGSDWKLVDQTGSWVVVAFQAEWCVPCRKEVKELAALQRSHPDVRIVTVGFMETPKQTKRFVEETGVGWTAVPDPDGDISSQWKVTAIPAAFLITPEGRVHKKYIGTLTEKTLAAVIDGDSPAKGSV